MTSDFLKAIYDKFYLVHSWISWPIYYIEHGKLASRQLGKQKDLPSFLKW